MTEVAEVEDKVTTQVKKAATKATCNVPQRRRGVRHSSRNLLTFQTIPTYLKDNEFIVTGYRPHMPFTESFKSLFRLHNETGNIWTHLLGFLLFVMFTVYITMKPPAPLALGEHHAESLWESVQGNLHHFRDALGKQLHNLQDNLEHNLHNLQDNLQHSVHSVQDSISHNIIQLQQSLKHSIGDNIPFSVQSLQDNLHSQAHSLQVVLEEKLNSHLEHLLGHKLQWPTSRWPAYVFLAGAMLCLLTSSICHLFSCCSQHVAKVIWRFDYASIAILIVSSFFPPVYYGFLCIPFWRNFYLISTSALGMVTIVVSLLPFFQGIPYRTFRASLYACLGLWGIAPIVHLSFLYPGVWHIRQAVIRDVIMGAVYLGGAAIYSQRIPERWGPGKFDVAFHSHQIFHVAVVAAAMVHYSAVLLLLEWRDASGGCAAPITAGPVSQVIESMKENGHAILGMEQVLDTMRNSMFEYLGLRRQLS